MPELSYPEKTIGELIESGAISFVNGFPCGEHNSNGQGVLQVRPFNVSSSGAIDLNEQKHIPLTAAEGKATLIRSDIIFNNTNTKELVGKTALWDGAEECVFSNHMTRLRVLDEDISPRYLATALHAHWLAGKSQMLARQHVAQASILGERFREIAIPWPQAPEQEALARAFSALHASLLAEAQMIDTVRALKRAAMRELFTRGLRGEAQKETEIGPVPESWRVGPLGELARFQRGFDITKGEQTDGDVPVVSSGGVKSYHNQVGAKGPGVLVGRKGSIGLLHYVEADYWPHDTTLWCTDYLGNVPKFVFYRVHTLDMKRLDSGAANPALNRNFLHSEIVSWPGPNEQREIVGILDSIDRKIDLHQKKCAVLGELFKALLHKLMRGEIRVADLDLAALAPPGSEAGLQTGSGRFDGGTIARTPSYAENAALPAATAHR